jgi:hypothetical protein
VDATVWTADQEEAFLGPGIGLRPLSDRVMGLVGEKSYRRPLSPVRARRSAGVLKATIHADEVMEIQSKIVSEEKSPEY